MNDAPTGDGGRRGFLPVKKLIRSTRGATAIEYAILLALVVVSGLAGYLVFATRTNQGFRSAARLLGPEMRSRQTSSPVNSAKGTSSRPGALHSDWTSTSPGRTENPMVGRLRIVAWVATLVASAMLLWRIRQGSGKADPVEGRPTVAPLPPGAFEHLLEKRQQIRRLLTRHFENSPGFNTQVRHLMSD